MTNSIRDKLVPKGRTIFFDEATHKYTNELGFVYTSTTTVIGKYVPKKDFTDIAKACERIGKNPNHPKYEHYKGKTWKQLVQQWEATTKESCEFGTIKHNFLETSVRKSTKYNLDKRGFINGRIYTIDDIIENHKFGKLSIKDFDKMGVKDKYPAIYDILTALSKLGYNIYAEIGVYDDMFGISGLIDILCVNHKTSEFIIVDWKTNKAPIRFDSGHYEKTIDGRLDLNKWKPNEEYFEYPLKHLADSVGNHYTLQLSVYAYLVTTFGYKFKGLCLCHIRPLEDAFRPREEWREVVEIYRLKFLEDDVKALLGDFKTRNLNNQGRLMFNN